MLKIKEVFKKFNSIEVLNGVNLEIQDGELFSLLGKSGSGKTTLLRVIAGLENLSSGEISLDEKIISSKDIFLAPKERKIGLIFQDFALFPHLSVEENIAFAAKTKDSIKRIKYYIKILKLEKIRSKYPEEISGGEQQRVAIARSLATNPALILMDEPFSNIDYFLRRELLQEMKLIFKKEKVSVLLVTHNQEEALAFSDKVAFLNEGIVSQVGTPEEIYQFPINIEIAKFIGDSNILKVEALNGKVATKHGPIKIAENFSGKCFVVIRPEDVILSKNNDGAYKIIDKNFFGHDVEIVLQNGKENIIAKTLSTVDKYIVGDKFDIKFSEKKYHHFL